jgi:hypothetical protein
MDLKSGLKHVKEVCVCINACLGIFIDVLGAWDAGLGPRYAERALRTLDVF